MILLLFFLDLEHILGLENFTDPQKKIKKTRNFLQNLDIFRWKSFFKLSLNFLSQTNAR